MFCANFLPQPCPIIKMLRAAFHNPLPDVYPASKSVHTLCITPNYSIRMMKQKTYHYIRGSDVVRDGMFLELIEADTSPQKQLAEVFYSDVTQELSLTYQEPDIPISVMNDFMDAALKLLPPKNTG